MEKSREPLFQKLTYFFLALFALHEIAMGVYNIAIGQPYYYWMAFGGLLFLPLPFLLWKLLGLQNVWQLDFVILLFLYLSFSIGIVSAGYYTIPYYDKAMHTVSGVFVGFLALVSFYWLKPVKKIEKSDCPLCSVFIFSFSLAVAGLWEICEYAMSLVTGMDPQRVATTGVGDSMQDMIVCMLGTILFLVPTLVFYQRGKKDFFLGAFTAYFEINFKRS